MKLAIVAPYPPSKDGIAEYSRKFVESLGAHKDISVSAIVSKKSDGAREPNQHALLSLSPFDWIKIYKTLKTADIVHLQFDISNYLLQIPFLLICLVVLRFKSKAKLIATYHEAYRDMELYGILSIVFYRVFNKIFDRIYVHTALSRDRLVGIYHADPNKVRCISHGTNKFVSKKVDHKDLRERYGIPTDANIVLNFGYIYRTKGIEYLIEALSLLKSEDNTPYVIIAGEVPKRTGLFKYFQRKNETYLADLKYKVEEKGLEKYVRFVGYVRYEELYSLFTLANVVVLPYTHIDQSGVLNYAIAAHTPVIASKIGGLKETLASTGILVEPRNAKILASEIKSFFENSKVKELVDKYKILARSISTDAVVGQIVNDYREILCLEKNGSVRAVNSDKASAGSSTILYISIDSAWGKSNAPSTHTFSLSESLGRLGNRVYVVTTGRGPSITIGNITYVRVPTFVLKGNLIQQVLKFVWNNVAVTYIAARIKSDVIYERHNVGLFSGVLLSIIKKRRLFYEVNVLSDEEIIQSHHIESPLVAKALHQACRFQLRRARAVLVQTSELKRAVTESYGLGRVLVAENGVTAAKSPPSNPKTKSTLRKFIYVSTIDEYHLVDQILELFASQKMKYQLVIVGDGDKLKDYRESYGHFKNIRFTGMLPHDEAMLELSKADMGIANYNLDSPLFQKFGFYFCPLKLLEYASFGLPSIVIGEANSVVKTFQHSGASLVVSDVKKFMSAIDALNADPARVSNMTQGAYKISGKFTWDRTAIKTLEAFNEY